jgi:predicted nuclease of predicted toxin-antitoxin system
VRFVLDEMVDHRVVGMLDKHGHRAWTISGVLAGLSDDDVSVYADGKGATVLSHDVEFSARRRRNPIGRHVQLRCQEPEALAVLEAHLEELVERLTPHPDVFVAVSTAGVTPAHLRWG